MKQRLNGPASAAFSIERHRRAIQQFAEHQIKFSYICFRDTARQSQRNALQLAHGLLTNPATTFLCPALSKAISSLSPSIDRMLPIPNFWWNTRSPLAKSVALLSGFQPFTAFSS